MTHKIDREIAEHPERFDFSDVPAEGTLKAAHAAQLDARQPEWLKELIAKAQAQGAKAKAS